MNVFPLPLTDVKTQYVIDGRLIPAQFPYLHVLLQGRPRHGMDDFSFRHPQMERGKRAKLFAPFDALDGYSANIASKNTLYTEKIALDDSQREEMNRRISILHHLTLNSRMAKANRVAVTVEYFVPCADKNSFSFRVQGQYAFVSGIVGRVDTDIGKTLTVNHLDIPLEDILSITPAQDGLFDWESSSY